MSEIVAIASSAIAMNQSRMQEQISMMLLKANAQAQQSVADMLAQNARQIEELSENSAVGTIDIFV
jgi:hypothetical protein